MALLRYYPFDVASKFTNVYTIQANNQVLDPTTAPNGIPDHLEVADWGGDIGQALKATLLESDAGTAGVNSHRSEIAFPHYTPGEYWWSYEIFIPNDFPNNLYNGADNNGFDGMSSQVLFSFNDTNITDDPIFGGRFLVDRLYPHTHGDFVVHSGNLLNNPDAPLSLGRWHQVIVHAYWTDSGGFIEMTCDGVFLFRRVNVQTAFTPTSGRVYMKVGLYNYYHRANYTKATAYYRNVKFYDNAESWQSVLGYHPAPPWQPFIPEA